MVSSQLQLSHTYFLIATIFAAFECGIGDNPHLSGYPNYEKIGTSSVLGISPSLEPSTNDSAQTETRWSTKSYTNAILPFSEYQKHGKGETKNVNQRKPETENDSLTPRIIYLPTFANVTGAFSTLSDNDPEDFLSSKSREKIPDIKSGRKKNPIRAQTHRNLLPVSLLTSNATFPSYGVSPLDSALGGKTSAIIYSTSSTREPLQFHKSLFRSKTNNNLNSVEPSKVNSAVGRLSSSYAPIASSTESGPLSSIFQPSSLSQTPNQASSKYLGSYGDNEGSLLRPVLSGTSSYGDLRPTLGQQHHLTKNILPAPYSKLSPGASDSNIVDSIFAQSQSQVRHSPQSLNGLNAIVPSQSVPSGMPFNLFGGTAGLNQLLGGANGFNPLELLSQGSTLEQISRIAKNLLAMSASNNDGGGNSQLLSTLTKAITAGTSSDAKKLTSTAVNKQSDNSTTETSNKSIDNTVETALNSTIDSINVTESQQQLANNSMKLLSSLPPEQRSLLEAAIKNGELDGSNLAPSLSTLLEQLGMSENKSANSTIHGENRLMEWIQQNRPRSYDKENSNNFVVLPSDRLPYYGRYCGSFVSNHFQSIKPYNIAGAVWAADNRRLIVSKFNFRPGSRTENISFWAGPYHSTGTAMDVFPSENGFYLKPQPIDIQTFMIRQHQKIPAKIRQASNSKVPAAETEEDRPETVPKADSNITNSTKNDQSNDIEKVKMKRNLYDELYGTKQTTLTSSSSSNVPSPQFNTGSTIHFTINPVSSTLSPTKSTSYSSSALFSTDYGRTPTIQNTGMTPSTSFVITAGSSVTVAPTSLNTVGLSLDNDNAPLDWYAGFQPLLLTLPEKKFVNDLHWVSIYDHNRKEAIAYVLIPNGPAFQIPSIVQLRPLAPNPGYQTRSGVIKILDTKMIEISNFSLVTSGLPTWFMVGKELLPNVNGHIVPLFNKITNEFDCTSLRDYDNETIILRLPGSLEIRDIFWFSVFSIPQGISLAHIHLPYNEIHSSPDLLAIDTPQCIWKEA